MYQNVSFMETEIQMSCHWPTAVLNVLKVMEVAKSTLDAGEEISTELMAKLLKFQLLCMKTSDLQRATELKVRWTHMLDYFLLKSCSQGCWRLRWWKRDMCANHSMSDLKNHHLHLCATKSIDFMRTNLLSHFLDSLGNRRKVKSQNCIQFTNKRRWQTCQQSRKRKEKCWSGIIC